MERNSKTISVSNIVTSRILAEFISSKKKSAKNYDSYTFALFILDLSLSLLSFIFHSSLTSLVLALSSLSPPSS